MPNPISRMANVETVEGAFPIRYLFRRRMLDSGGTGRYRGGLGGEIAIVPHGSPDGRIQFVLSGKGSKFPMSDGLAGGGSGTANDYVLYRGANGQAAAPRTESSAAQLQGTPEPISWGVFSLNPADAFYLRWNGGGGVGDPLLRPIADVAHDVASRTVSEEAAETLYGVVFDAGEPDEAATEARRRQMKADRLNTGAHV